MFKRIFVEEWALYVPVISFCIFFGVFLAVTIRTLRLKKSERERLAAMPLDKHKDSHKDTHHATEESEH